MYCYILLSSKGETHKCGKRPSGFLPVPGNFPDIMKGQPMNIIISHSSMVPIYEQITAQIKASVMDGNLAAGDLLPSVRSLSKELKISALTVKKAYDRLEEEGFVVTVHGKGSFIAAANQELMMEERRRDVEASLETAIQKGRQYGLSDGEIRSLFELVLED